MFKLCLSLFVFLVCLAFSATAVLGQNISTAGSLIYGVSPGNALATGISRDGKWALSVLWGNPGKGVLVNASDPANLTKVGSALAFPSGDDGCHSVQPDPDPTRQYFYVNCAGVVLKLKYNESGLFREDALTVAAGTAHGSCQDTTAGLLYFGSVTLLHKINASNFSIVESLTPDGSDTTLYRCALVDDEEYIYVGYSVAPGRTVKYFRSNFSFVARLVWGTGYNYATDIALHPASRVGFTGFSVSPGRLGKFHMDTMANLQVLVYPSGTAQVLILCVMEDYVLHSTSSVPAKFMLRHVSDMSAAGELETPTSWNYPAYTGMKDVTRPILWTGFGSSTPGSRIMAVALGGNATTSTTTTSTTTSSTTTLTSTTTNTSTTTTSSTTSSTTTLTPTSTTTTTTEPTTTTTSSTTTLTPTSTTTTDPSTTNASTTASAAAAGTTTSMNATTNATDTTMNATTTSAPPTPTTNASTTNNASATTSAATTPSTTATTTSTTTTSTTTDAPAVAPTATTMGGSVVWQTTVAGQATQPPLAVQITIANPANFSEPEFKKKLGQLLGVAPTRFILTKQPDGCVAPDCKLVLVIFDLGFGNNDNNASGGGDDERAIAEKLQEKALKLNTTQLAALGAASIVIVHNNPPASESLPLWAIIVIAAAGALIIGLLLFIALRKHSKKTQEEPRENVDPIRTTKIEHTATFGEAELNDRPVLEMPMMEGGYDL